MSSVVIVGAGHAGVQVADTLRAMNFGGSIILLGEDPAVPYQRPLLSKDFVSEQEAKPLPLRAEKFYTEARIELRTGVRVIEIERSHHRLRLDDGTAIPYSNLVLATGAANRPLDIEGTSLSGVHSLRTLGDAEALRADLSTSRSVVVVGAGFIGLEFAAAAHKRGIRVTVLESGERPMSRAVSTEMSSYIAGAHRRLGTDLRLGEGLVGLAGRNGRVRAVVSTRGREYPADLVILGVGVVPRDELARSAGLEVENGILVDHLLRTGDPAIYAVGDCASRPDATGTGRVRIESAPNAIDQGRHVAKTILGEAEPYASLPLFWSHQGPLRLQIAGLATSSDRSVVCGDMEQSRFSVFRFRKDCLVAVESINHPADHMSARTALGLDRHPTPDEVAEPGFCLKDHVKQRVRQHPAPS